MNFIHLFTTARVMRASYQIVSTAILFYYLGKRLSDGRGLPRARRRIGEYED